MTLLSSKQVRKLLEIGEPRTLRAMMDETPEHIERPWVQVGVGAKRPRFRWQPGDPLWRWLREVTEWRALEGKRTGSGTSAGATRKGATGKGRSTSAAPRSRSAAKPRQPKTKASPSSRSGREQLQRWLR